MCFVMHFGFNNERIKYDMVVKMLDKVPEEQELGVILQNDLKCN